MKSISPIDNNKSDLWSWPFFLCLQKLYFLTTSLKQYTLRYDLNHLDSIKTVQFQEWFASPLWWVLGVFGGFSEKEERRRRKRRKEKNRLSILRCDKYNLICWHQWVAIEWLFWHVYGNSSFYVDHFFVIYILPLPVWRGRLIKGENILGSKYDIFFVYLWSAIVTWKVLLTREYTRTNVRMIWVQLVANLGTTLRQQVDDGQEESLIANEQVWWSLLWWCCGSFSSHENNLSKTMNNLIFDWPLDQGSSNGKKKKYLGKIKYRVDYDFITSTLTVTVIECKVGSQIKIRKQIQHWI